jgi:uncharacterized protein YegL
MTVDHEASCGNVRKLISQNGVMKRMEAQMSFKRPVTITVTDGMPCRNSNFWAAGEASRCQ